MYYRKIVEGMTGNVIERTVRESFQSGSAAGGGWVCHPKSPVHRLPEGSGTQYSDEVLSSEYKEGDTLTFTATVGYTDTHPTHMEYVSAIVRNGKFACTRSNANSRVFDICDDNDGHRDYHYENWR